MVLETARLRLRWLCLDDAGFILELLNDPSFVRNIGDKGCRTLEDARQYLLTGPMDSYQRRGHGLYRVELKEDGAPIGICGLIYREHLREVDVGYALLPAFFGRGYAVESAAAVLAYGREQLGFSRIVAVTSSDNLASKRVLEKIGLRFEKKIRMPKDQDQIDVDVDLFA